MPFCESCRNFLNSVVRDGFSIPFHSEYYRLDPRDYTLARPRSNSSNSISLEETCQVCEYMCPEWKPFANSSNCPTCQLMMGQSDSRPQASLIHSSLLKSKWMHKRYGNSNTAVMYLSAPVPFPVDPISGSGQLIEPLSSFRSLAFITSDSE
jgi:hypothetical protein